ncbi:hypothetical protein F442_12162, partial [Phytophthora nicotianae P10297]
MTYWYNKGKKEAPSKNSETSAYDNKNIRPGFPQPITRSKPDIK